ncbi:MAG: DUF3365 domain-containing protein [Armatimonadota bacterium]
MKFFKISEEQIVLFVVVLILMALIASVFVWTYNRQKTILKSDLEGKARLIADQLNALRHFIAHNQNLINYSHGVFEYKGLGPQKVATSVADILNNHPDYKYRIKMVSLKPRNPNNNTDDFESKNIKIFEANKKLEDIFEEKTVNGEKVYRYMKPLVMGVHCMACHGSPKGVVDKSGYPKEGYKLGDVIGAVSITVPADVMTAILNENTKSLTYFLLIVGIITIASIFFLTSRLISVKRQIEKINKLLSEKNDELLNLEKVKSDLTHMIVHDFRGTLANIMGYLSLLLDEHMGKFNESQREFTEAALINSKKLLNMASDLLDINKLEEDRMPLNKQSVDLIELFEEKEDFWSKSGSLENKKVEVKIEGSLPVIETDRNILERILDNLVYNAIKHTTPGKGRIKILCAYEEDKKRVVFKVADNGEGIPKEYLEKVFDKFFQVEAARTKKIMGLGLGLTFCKMAVEALEGDIRIESEESKGTAVIVSLNI